MLGEAAVRPPWERCEGCTNIGLGLRKAGLAARRVGGEARDASFRYVSDVRAAHERPGPGWVGCRSVDGSDRAPSLTAGRLSTSPKPVRLWQKSVRRADMSPMNRGDAAAGTWIVRGGEA